MNRYLLILFVIALTFSTLSFSQDKIEKKVNSKQLITNALEDFESGKYDDAILKLDDLEKRLKKGSKKYNEIKGLIHYWRGLSHARLNNYKNAEIELQEAVNLKYKSKDELNLTS